MNVRTLRLLGAVFLGLGLTWAATAQDPEKPSPVRFGVMADTEVYPQATAKQALASVIKAIDRRRFDYLLAHLADPAFVDARLKGNTSPQAFDALVKEVAEKITGDPTSVDELRSFLRKGTWEDGDTATSVKLDEVKGRVVVLKKVEDRWVLDNRRTPEPAK